MVLRFIYRDIFASLCHFIATSATVLHFPLHEVDSLSAVQCAVRALSRSLSLVSALPKVTRQSKDFFFGVTPFLRFIPSNWSWSSWSWSPSITSYVGSWVWRYVCCGVRSIWYGEIPYLYIYWCTLVSICMFFFLLFSIIIITIIFVYQVFVPGFLF